MSYVAVVFIVGLVIAIHECGHLLAAKWCGIPVERFSIGFGPKLFGFRRGETSYWVSIVPIAGYVLPALDANAFRRLPLRKNILFALGGPVANVAAAYLGLIYQPLYRIQAPVTLAGWVLMLLLMVYATIQDLGRLGLTLLS